MKKYPLSQEKDWTEKDLHEYVEAIDEIATEELRLSVYPNQIEIITAEQMLDAYSSVGLPVNYLHWSYGKDFMRDYDAYKQGRKGLAYEIVINSNPCIAYCMEENTLPMQALVIAHASYGHNAFFKNNYLFKERTQADTIIDYMCQVRDDVNRFEQQYGLETVERFIDHVHSLRNYACDHYLRARKLSNREQNERRERELAEEQAARNALWDDLIYKDKRPVEEKAEAKFPEKPTENILKFIGRFAPNLEDWQRQIIEHICYIQNYFWPQSQTQVGNEGFATFTHRYIIQRLYEKGLVGESFMHELLLSHTNVIAQPEYNKRWYSGTNPYALGYAMYEDIRRICTNPTKEDEKWFPHLIGQDWVQAIQHAAFNHRDESFIETYLSPKVVRDLRLFASVDNTGLPYTEIVGTHDDKSFEVTRRMMSEQKHRHRLLPHIEVSEVRTRSDRALILTHHSKNGVYMNKESVVHTLYHISQLWQFDVIFETIDEYGDTIDEFIVEYEGDLAAKIRSTR